MLSIFLIEHEGDCFCHQKVAVGQGKEVSWGCSCSQAGNSFPPFLSWCWKNCSSKEQTLKWSRTLACEVSYIYSWFAEECGEQCWGMYFATRQIPWLPCFDIHTNKSAIHMQMKGLDVDSLYISHIQVNQAQKQRRRTYRAHGRINRMFLVWRSVLRNIRLSNMYFLFWFHLSLTAYMSHPCHIELILSEKEEPVRKEVILWYYVPFFPNLFGCCGGST